MDQIISEILFLGQRFDRSAILDILLVAVIFFIILNFIQSAQANSLLRGTIVILVLFSLLYILADLPGFTWLIGNILPALLLLIPIIYAPEIRRSIERLGRIESLRDVFSVSPPFASETAQVVPDLVQACKLLSSKNHGALIVIQRFDDLEKYISTGVFMDAIVTPEALANIFYPNTPLHDGAAIIRGARIQAAACIMPLSSRNVLDKTPGRQMGLRHRAALGTSELNDSVTIVVSEETGHISVAFEGVIYKQLTVEKLELRLNEMFRPRPAVPFAVRLANFFRNSRKRASDLAEIGESEEK